MSTIELPWVEKYRPNKITDVIGHVTLVNTLRKFVDAGALPHMLLHGPPGTGKTTIVKALTQEIYGAEVKSMVLTLNASDDRGIDVVRNVIKEFASVSKISISKNENISPAASMKIVILDEADQMTSAAQMSLRRIIELYSSTVRFCILCNYINKINPAIQSRCTKFRVPPLRMDTAVPRLAEICRSENIVMDDEALKAMFRISQGDMRRLVNTLQSIAMMGENKSVTNVFKDLGYPDPQCIDTLKEIVLTESFEDIYNNLIELQVTRGLLLSDILGALYYSMIDHTEWPLSVAGILVPKFADILHHLSKGANFEVMSGAIASIIIEARYVNQKLLENK